MPLLGERKSTDQVILLDENFNASVYQWRDYTLSVYSKGLSLQTFMI